MAAAIAMLVVAGTLANPVSAAPAVFSGAWFAAKSTTQSQARANGVATAGGLSPGGQQAQQANQQLQRSITDLGLAAQVIAQQQAWQASQRQIALSGGNGGIPDGMAAGGLNVDTNSLTQTWINAQAPTQSVDGSGHVTVNVTQTASRAILSWSSFNIGKNTTLNFDQSGGTQSNGANDWAVLNRINDPNEKPSSILGSITAQGSVYVINRNGIMFGGGSQVNVHSLVASTLDFLNTNDDLVQTPNDVAASNALFMSSVGGLAGLEAGQTGVGSGVGAPNEVLGLGNNVSVPVASQYQAPGNITIEAGASIATHTNGAASDGGLILIAATNVNNAGNITATGGQAILAAGVGVSLKADPSSPQMLIPELTGKITAADRSGADITPVSTLTNVGIIQTPRGALNLLGTNVLQNGVAGATTSVSVPGSITISTVDEYVADTPAGTAYPGQSVVTAGESSGVFETHRAGQLVFGGESVTTILPDTDGETATSSPGVTFTPGSITITAGSVWFQNGSLVEAPGSNVSVAALTPSSALDAAPPGDTAIPGRIYLDNGATIDVAGLADVQEAVADTLVTIGLVGQNELADSPLLRNSFLSGLKDVVIDSTLSGTRADGTPWVGSPVLNAQGYVDLIPRSIEQLLTNAGAIELSGAQVMTAQRSNLNLDGGFVHYLGGMVQTTVVEDQYGQLVPIGQVDPNDFIVGIAGQYIDTHPRWGVSETYQNPLIGRAQYEDDFIVGGNAGTLSVYGSQAVVLDGAMSAQAVASARQIQDNGQPAGGTFNLGTDPIALNPGSLGLADLTLGVGSGVSGESGTVILQDTAPQLNDLNSDFSANTPLNATALAALSGTDPNNVLATQVVPVDMLGSGGFTNVSVTEDPERGNGIVVVAGSQLTVQPGGSITLNTPGAVTVLGNLIAPSGAISITSGGNIDLGPDAILSVAGQWINNATQAPGTAPGGSEFINGGSITLSASESGSGNQQGRGVDTSGSIFLESGSVLDVSSGGELQANGQLLMTNGTPAGEAGSLSLITYAGNDTDGYGTESVLPQDQPMAGRIEMDGTIDSFGFAGGGTLTLQALGFQVGGDPIQAPSWDLFLPTDFFAQQGFGKYVLNAIYDATVAPDAVVRLTQQNLIPNVAALQQAATGADISNDAFTTAGTVDPYYRQATDLVMTAGAYLAWTVPVPFGVTPPRPSYAGVTGAVTIGEGASIVGDAGASIGLGSPAQVTVLGSIIAPGGSITLSADSAVAAPYGQTGQYLNSGGYTSESKSVWLGSDAVLDVSGIALTDPFAPFVRTGLNVFEPLTGKILAGGSVILSDDSGYVVAQSGALIDVSGTSATFDEPQANGGYAPQAVWSDAGAITLGASAGLYFDGTLQAQPGGGQAQGGTLTLMAQQNTVTAAQQPGGGIPVSSAAAQVLILQQSGDLLPAGQMPGDDFAGAFATTLPNGTPVEQTSRGVLEFSADRLTGSGIANLVLDGTSSVVRAPVPVAFNGTVSLNLAGSVIINTGQIIALDGGEVANLLAGTNTLATPTSTTPALLTAGATSLGAHTVTIAAPYVAIIGPTLSGSSPQLAPVEAVGDATLNVDASFIDLENQLELNNFGQSNFASSGDIRLTSTNGVLSGANVLLPGELFTPGNLTFQAADLYPSTGSTFILDAVGPAGSATTITFLANGASNVPLSAGGTLLVDASNIVQAGTVRAPFGSLIFGVGDANDAGTQTQFNNLPLVNTQSVALTDGSTTSVSADGAIIPFGTTVDGVEWQFNPVPNVNTASDLTSPPSKFISVNGNNVALNAGATIDLSGGGDLLAEEWVAGTGGSRDVLSQYNVSYASTPSGVAIPTNAGAANVYAILPGPQSPAAAYDPTFAQTLQPSKNANGSVGTTTDSVGVGQAALGGAVGASVYLSNVPGLPAGYYTLLPAKYATLPGAYRVTVANTSGTAVPGTHTVAPDGTAVVAGYFGNALSGSRDALPTLFDVQSGAAWQQYSQYTLTSANSFFTLLAVTAGNVTPPLPMDAGQLVLAATQSLSLGASLNTAAASGGAPAEVDIASQDIQIVGSGEAALAGYLQISADQLDALGAGSLLIGGTRTQTANGITINAIANSVVLSNDAADPLSGPELILVTKTDASHTDPNAANGLQVDSGSVMAAQGFYPAAKDQPITIGQTGGASGDGALLSVSNGGAAVVTRVNTTPSASNAGLLTVGADATLSGGQALTLDSSGNLTFDPDAALSGNTIAVDGSAITFTDQTGAAAAALPGFVVGAAQIAQLANAQQVILRSAGAMNFDGNVDVTFGNRVDLSAGTFLGDGGTVTINAPQVAFTNEMNAPASPMTAGPGTLTVNAGEVDFGAGDKTVSSFSAATINATGGIVGQGTGTFDFGALPVTLNAPVYLADTSSNATIQTTGTLNINSAMGTALAIAPVGGAFSFIGGTVNDNAATIAAPAGNVSMEATTGDLTIAGGSLLSSAGVSKPFFDLTEYAPGGAISLTSDTGTVNVQAGAILDFSAANGGGAAGSLSLSAPEQAVQLAGTIKGNAAAGFRGGAFSLNTGAAVDLDTLSAELASSGVNDAISVWTHTGNLILSSGNTLTAQTVSLTADGGANAQDANNGHVNILGTIDASGNAGGTINLYGKNGVDVEGTLKAIATADGGATLNPSQRGGTVNLGTSAIFDPSAIDPATGLANPYNATYGYENVFSSGAIVLGAHALIDVRGGTAGGLSGGTVNLRAPLLADGSVNVSVPVAFAPGAGIVGARSVALEAYAVWSTTDTTTGAQHFDGIVDPAGWYGDSVAGAGQPGMVDGTWTDQTGAPLAPPTTPAELTTYLANDFFTPTHANADHQSFYGYVNGDATQGAGTLMNFIEHGVQGVANQFAGTTSVNFAVTPGIELDNPTPATGAASVNNGNISILTNWNLGAGNSPGDLAFRFNGQAPIITFRAENNVEVDASLTDGFFQIANPTARPLSTITIDPLPQNYTEQSAYNAFYLDPYGNVNGYYAISQVNQRYFAGVLTAPAPASAFAGGDPAEISQYAAMYEEYLSNATNPSQAERTLVSDNTGNFNNSPIAGQPLAPSAPTLAQEQANPAAYAAAYQLYQLQYSAYAAQLAVWIFLPAAGMPGQDNAALPFQLVPPQAPLAVLTPIIAAPVTITTGTLATDNSPSPIATSANGLPMVSASLNGGSSTSFRIAAGADLSSTNPLALQAAALFAGSPGTAAGEDNVVLDGHFAYNNINNPSNANSLTLLAPTMIRTGAGSIDIAAANDVTLADPIAPGVIYTAGVPAAGAPPVGDTATIVLGSASAAAPDILVTPAVNPDSGGDISIVAQNDIMGMESVIDKTGAVAGIAGQNIGQFWWQWMEVGNPTGPVGATTPTTRTVQTSIDFGAFDQGVLSAGGNVTVSAGGNITDLAVSLPTSWYLTNANTDNPTVNTVGGGNLSVTAGGSILSGSYFVAKGTGTITAGGQIGSDFSFDSSSVSTLLATQDGVLNVNARQGADIGGVFDPSYLTSNRLANTYKQHADEQGYSSTSAVNIQSTTGDVNFNTLQALSLIDGGGSGDHSSVLPASVSLTAFTGGITVASTGTLFPSATGDLSLIADQSIGLRGSGSFGMSDQDPSSMPSPQDPNSAVSNTVHDATPLHADDAVPARIYSLSGSIVDGILEPAGSGGSTGFYDSLLNIVIDKPALIEAGQDILNLAFQGQNLRDADITRIVAARDIVDTPLPNNASVIPSLQLGGPGTFDIEAGRNIGPLTSQAEAFAALGSAYPKTGVVTGIDAVGDANNPNLPHESASVNVLFGVGPGVNDAGFIAAYIDPSNNVAGVPSSTPALIAFMQQYDAGLGVDTGFASDKAAVQATVGTLTAAQAWAQFQTLPSYVQQLFAEQVLFGVLTDVGQDFNNASSPFFNQYSRGYQAINTLFPASFGYTANDLTGGLNGANKLVTTGNLDIRSTTIQTQQGGNVTILGPGGEALVGSTSAPPAIVNSSGIVVAGPGTQGILTLEQGDIDIFTDQSLLLAQSRVFTEQGGDMTIWSSNGDINAGKGSKSSADIPPPNYVCDVNHYCTVDVRGEVTGAGIATLQTIPDAAPGDVNLLAPRGTVDAGDAGIRVSGDINIAALHVANIDNIQVQGKSTGIPIIAQVNVGALTSASAAASQAATAAENVVHQQQAAARQALPSIITVQVLGFGDESLPAVNDTPPAASPAPSPVNFNPNSAVRILGVGNLPDSVRKHLTEHERGNLGL